MNNDIKQANKFIGGFSLRKRQSHNWVQSQGGIDVEEAYIQIVSHGKKEGEVNDLNGLNELLIGKSRRDLHKYIWTKDLKEGLLSVEELIEDGYGDIAFDCMKDIVKTTDRLEEIEKLDYPLSMIATTNRNWFIDKLSIKVPDDIHLDTCTTCKESLWKGGNYVKN